LQADSAGRTSATRFAQANSPGVMTLGWFGTRVGQNEIGMTNSVTVHRVDPILLPSRASLEVVAERKGKNVCLYLRISPLRGEAQCFDGVGTTVSMAGWRYTLTSWDGKKSIGLRVDASIKGSGIGPRA